MKSIGIRRVGALSRLDVSEAEDHRRIPSPTIPKAGFAFKRILHVLEAQV